MHLSDLIYSDGLIEEYEMSEQTLHLRFQDYLGIRWLLSFFDVVTIRERGSIGISIAKVDWKRNTPHSTLSFWDDEQVVLMLIFSHCRIEHL
jgi:hypothetical protein